MRTRWLTLAALALTATGALSASAASATDPLTLDSGFVTDDAGVLSPSQEDAVEARLQELSDNSTSDLFVVFVDDFTSPSDSVRWADDVATANNLGSEQYLLAVAVEGRSYYISAAPDGPLSDARLDEIEDRILPFASAQDWDGMVEKAADEIQGDGGAGALRVFLVIAGIVAAALVIWLIVALVRRARRNAEVRRRGAMPERPDPNDPFSTLTDQQVETQAGSALVQADDAITSSKEELAFAVAQFGEAATAEFSGAIKTAEAKMSEAFDLRQKLDDEIEDSIHDRRAWHIRIIRLCQEVDELLDDNAEAFDALRKLEQNAPQELERVRASRAGLQASLDGAAAALSALSATYAPGALAAVADNPAQAQERAALADRAIDAAAQAVTAGRSGEAALAIRTAEQSIAQAQQLVNAISALEHDLAGLGTQAQALIAELEADMSAARQLPDPDGAIAAATAATAQQVQQAQAKLSGAGRDPQRALDELGAANTRIDAVIAQAREEAERVRRAALALQQTIAQADSEIRAVRGYIETRRGAIGPTARTRLSQAEAGLSQALSLKDADPVGAQAAASRALDLARQAGSSAQADLSAYSSPYQGDAWNTGGLFGGGSVSNGSDLAGDILGGIIGGLLSGGGGSSSRRSSWRSGGGGGFRSSGFGGGGRSISRSSGRSGRSGGRRF